MHTNGETFGPVPSKNIQIPPLRSDANFMKDAHSAESKEKSCVSFSNYYFSSSGRFCTENSSKITNIEYKNAISQKLYIAKI